MKLAALCALIAVVSVRSVAAQSAADTLNPLLAAAQQEVNDVARQQPFDYAKYTAAVEKAHGVLYALIARDALRTPTDFYTGSILGADPSGARAADVAAYAELETLRAQDHGSWMLSRSISHTP